MLTNAEMKLGQKKPKESSKQLPIIESLALWGGDVVRQCF
jgi:hypothetical protein